MNKAWFRLGAAALVVTLASGPSTAQEKKFLTMETFSPGSAAAQFQITFSQVIQKYMNVEIQNSIGKPGTKSFLDGSQGKVDLFLTAPTFQNLMSRGQAMFSQIENAPELAKNVRNILNYPLGPFQFVVYEDSGMKEMADLKGKTVYIGPPGSSGAKLAADMIEGVTGLKAGEDYQTPRFDWQSAETAFVDRQMDAIVLPQTLPSASVQQFALVSKIRLLSIPRDKLETDLIKEVLTTPGRSVEIIAPNTYENQANEEPVIAIGSWGGLGTHKGLDADLVYQMTKTMWEHIDEIRSNASWMKVITKDTVFENSLTPLHIGAYRYYKEAGFDIPEDQIPPEAKQ